MLKPKSLVVVLLIVSAGLFAGESSTGSVFKIYTKEQEAAAISASNAEEMRIQAERDSQKTLLDNQREDNAISIKDYYSQLKVLETNYYDALIATKKRLRDQLVEFHLNGASGIDTRSHSATQAGKRREGFASAYETKMLDQKKSYEVFTEGDEATTLVMRWNQIDRVFIHQLGKNARFLGKLKALGFTRLIVSDGTNLTGIHEFN